MHKQVFDEFIDSIELDSTSKVIKSMSAIGDYDYSDISMIELEHIVLSMKPNSPKAITTICYAMSLYAKHMGNKDMEQMVRDIDRKSLWLRAKPMASKKFISNVDFNRVCAEIDEHEEHNATYQRALFECVYHGVYSDDMSVVKNLRASDVHDDFVTLRTDNGREHELKLPYKLADELKMLGNDNEWWRNNRYGAFKVKTKGPHEDSCFKVEDRSGTSKYQGRYSYYRILRKISKEYVGYSLLPLQLYVSGITHRIGLSLNQSGYDMSDAFSDNNKDRFVNRIISTELSRSNYDIEVRNFREMVKGHIDVFYYENYHDFLY